MESRLLCGSEALFERFRHAFRRQVQWRRGSLAATIVRSRMAERARFGETVFLLEPNIKRSQGGLRDMQLLRWIGFVRYGTPDPRELRDAGVLDEDDFLGLQRAGEFLLWLRNDLHFHAAQVADVLTRSEQLRLAAALGYEPIAGLLPVEQFMREYFRHTNLISHVSARFVAKATSSQTLAWFATAMFGHHVEEGVRVGPVGIMATRRGLQKLRGNLAEIIRLADLANLYDAPIAPATWDFIRRQAREFRRRPVAGGVPLLPLPAVASRPARTAAPRPARRRHPATVHPRIRPRPRPAPIQPVSQVHGGRALPCAVEFATQLAGDAGPLGRVYRGIAEKRILHLALLIHDLGKGFLEDHREIGLKIAEGAAIRLGLAAHEAEALKFLVHKHLRMNHLAFRRDAGDEDTVVHFAVLVGSPELLQMLYVLTAADLGAVGPGVWDGWKAEILTDLYHRTMQQLAGESLATTIDALLDQRREEIRRWLGPAADDPWFHRHVANLPSGYLNVAAPQQAAEDLKLLYGMEPKCGDRHGPIPRGDGDRPVHRRHVGRDCRGDIPPAHRGADQPRPGDPLGADSHLGGRAGAGPLLGPRPRFRRRAAAGAARGGQPLADRVAAGFGAAIAVVPPHVASGPTSPRSRAPPPARKSARTTTRRAVTRSST